MTHARPDRVRFLPLAAALAALLAGFVGCCPQPTEPVGRVLSPRGLQQQFDWSEEQLARDVAAQPLRVTEHASYSIVRVRTAEKPHVHDRSDLAVTVLRGRVLMHLGEQVAVLSPGDVIDIPRGVVHWAQNLGPADSAAEAFVVGTPPYRGDDLRLVTPQASP